MNESVTLSPAQVEARAERFERIKLANKFEQVFGARPKFSTNGELKLTRKQAIDMINEFNEE